MLPVVAIIQARMGSSRLPGKSLYTLGYFKIIDWVVSRVSSANLVDDVIVAMPDCSLDDPLEEYIKAKGLHFYRGSENDVYKRFKGALVGSPKCIVVRVCADRPLVCPNLVDEAIDFFRQSNADIVYNHKSGIAKEQKIPFGFGVEVFSSEYFFDDKYSRRSLSSYDLEHVTPRLYESSYKNIFVPPKGHLVNFEGKYDLDDTNYYERLKNMVDRGLTISDSFYQICENIL